MSHINRIKHLIEKADAFKAENGEKSAKLALEKANSLFDTRGVERIDWLIIYHYLRAGIIMDITGM